MRGAQPCESNPFGVLSLVCVLFQALNRCGVLVAAQQVVLVALQLTG